MQNTYYMKKYFAEGIGTFALVLFGCGAAVVSGKTLPDTIMSGAPAGIGVLGIALAFGLAVVVMCYAIGLTLVIIHLVAIPITGTSVNPARSFGPALFAGGKALQQLWLFIVAPVIGGIVAALLWRGLFETESK